jgi:hypothetical protein
MATHNLEVVRYSTTKTDTLGVLLADSRFLCYTLEDTHHEIKQHSETRIPNGIYKLEFQPQLTKMTVNYQVKFQPWFKLHLHVKNVPGFEGIYLHNGSDASDTSGCLLLADQVKSNVDGTPGKLLTSNIAYERVYKLIKSWLDLGDTVTITYKNVY